MKKAVFIDPGHGGIDPGCPLGEGEKEYNVRIANCLASMLQARGYKVEQSRRNDLSVSLKQRCQMANAFYQANGGIFVSIHHNASTSTHAEGMEVFYCRGSRVGYVLANNMITGMQTYLYENRIVNRGVKEGSFYVLRHTKAPAVLVECEFLTGPKLAEIKNCSSAWVHHMAKVLLRGIELTLR